MSYSKKKFDGGFTLPEVLLAAAIVAGALAGLGAAFMLSQRSAAVARRQVAAVHEARGALEQLASSDFYGAPLTVGRHMLSNGYYDVTSVDSRTKNVEVRVRWLSPRGTTNWVVLTTSVSSAVHY